MLQNHKYCHFFKSGRRLNIDILREENKCPKIVAPTKLNINTPLTLQEEIEYAMFLVYMSTDLLNILTPKEAELLAEEGKKKFNKFNEL